MSQITRIEKSRKAFKCQKCGKELPVGTAYLRGKRNFAKDIIRCTDCGLQPYELSSSDYVRDIGHLKDSWEDDFGTGDGCWEELSSNLNDIRTDLQERLDNMPEQLQECGSGEVLQNRIDGLDAAIDALDEMDYADIVTDIIDELDEDDQNTLERINEERYPGQDYDMWVQGFIEAATADVPAKWAVPYRELAASLSDSIDEAIYDSIDEALSNLADD